MLKKNPFFILDVSLRDSQEVIAEAFDEKLADGEHDEGTLFQAQRTLMASKPRLEAELSWFPDITPKKAKELAKHLELDYSKTAKKYFYKTLGELNGLSKANLAANICMDEQGDVECLKAIVSAQSEISIQSIQSEINATRKVSGFPDVNEDLISDQLEKLNKIWAEAAVKQIFTAEHSGNYMVELLNVFSQNENEASKRFLDILMERYESSIVPTLRDHEDTINEIISGIKNNNAKDANDDVDRLIRELELWDEYAQPSQLVHCEKGLDEPRSKKIYENIRDFSLWLANEANEHQLSLKISKAAKDIFAELPFVINRIEQDISALEDLIADAEMEDIVAPLFDLVLQILTNDKDFAKSLRKREFSEGAGGLAGEVYSAFLLVRKDTDNTNHAALPWEMLRKVAIHLNNESENPEAAMKILKKLQSIDPPEGISDQIDEDIHTMEENILGRDLRIALETKNKARIKALLKELIEHGRNEEEKKEWKILLHQVENQKRQLPWGLIIWGIIIFGAIGLDECSGPSGKKSSTSSSYRSSSSTPANPIETKPQYNKSGALSINELRWCMYQSKRMDFIQNQFPTSEYDYNAVALHNARLITQEVSDQYDALINDYNSRCYNASYYENSERIVNRELNNNSTMQQIKLSAKNTMRSWNANFRFKE